MKFRKLITGILLTGLLAVCVSGCAASQIFPWPTPAPPATMPPVLSTKAPEPTPTPEPTPEPLPALGIKPGKYDEKYTAADGNWLAYWAYVPQNATEDMPMIVYLHGDSRSYEDLPVKDIALRTSEIYGDNFPYILITPGTREPEWFAGWIGPTLKELIDTAAEQYKVDKEKIVITGYSRGAIGAWKMADTYGDYFSACVPVSCGADIKGEHFAGVPVSAFCGGTYNEDYNTYYSWMKYMVQQINDAGGSANITVPDGYDHHEMGYAAYSQDVLEWMIAQ